MAHALLCQGSRGWWCGSETAPVRAVERRSGRFATKPATAEGVSARRGSSPPRVAAPKAGSGALLGGGLVLLFLLLLFDGELWLVVRLRPFLTFCHEHSPASVGDDYRILSRFALGTKVLRGGRGARNHWFLPELLAGARPSCRENSSKLRGFRGLHAPGSRVGSRGLLVAAHWDQRSASARCSGLCSNASAFLSGTGAA